MVDASRWLTTPALALSLALSSCGGRAVSGLTGSNGIAEPTDTSDTSGASTASGAGGGNGAGSGSGQGGSATTVTVSASVSEGASVAVSAASNTTTGGLTGTEIPFFEGWAPLDQNAFGIQGAFWTADDGSGSIGEYYSADNGTAACAQGIATQVLLDASGMPDYARYWGAILGINLAQEAGVPTPLAYDATAHGVIGFGFVIAGDNPIPPSGELRISVKVLGDPNIYCNSVSQHGPQTFTLSSLYQSCWERDASAPTPDPTKLESLQWQYVTNVLQDYEFDLCITNLWVIQG